MTQDETNTSNEQLDEAPVNDPETFGGCPVCGKNDGYLNNGCDHWFYCEAHKIRWCFGENLFSSWKYETEEDFRRTRELLADYEVAPCKPFRDPKTN